MDKKRIIFAALFLVICVLLGYALYRVFFSKGLPAKQTEKQTEEAGRKGFPSIGEEAKKEITPDVGKLPASREKPSERAGQDIAASEAIRRAKKTEIVSKTVDAGTKSVSTGAGGDARFYNTQDGKFYRLTDSGQITPLSDQVFYNIENATWSPVKNESIIEYPDGSNVLYDFDSRKQVTLPKHWENFSFSPFGDKIAAKSIGIDAQNRWLITSNPDGSSISVVESLGNNSDKVMIDWSPNKKVIALSRTGDPVGGDAQEIVLIGANKENFKSLVVEGRGLEAKWSPAGKKLLHSVYSGRSDYKPELWIVNGEPDTVGAGRKPLGVNTWASKCAMADDRFAYCGVPNNLDTGAGFAPDLYKSTSDKLYKIDTATGFKTEIPLDGDYTIDTINVDAGHGTLYFTDKNQDGVFKVKM